MIIWSYDHMIVGRHTVTIERYRVPPKRGAQRAPRIGGTYPHRGDFFIPIDEFTLLDLCAIILKIIVPIFMDGPPWGSTSIALGETSRSRRHN